MARTVGIGIQDFEKLRKNDLFYIDKTDFIREWWENNDDVTLIARPRRFGKTLNMSMLNCFFSNKYEGRGEELFSGLSIWESEKFRQFQGQYPVIFLSFADIKFGNFEDTRNYMISIMADLYKSHSYLLESSVLSEEEKEAYSTFDRFYRFDLRQEDPDFLSDSVFARSIKDLSAYLERYFGKKVLIFLDEYDTPMQEAYINGYWDELVAFTRSLFNTTFKTNPHLERAVITGITRISKESIFSDLNNLEVVTTTSEKYAEAFGFTEAEVFAAMDEQELGTEENYQKVRLWYDGFTFGSRSDIYNPWSIINYLNKKRLGAYWSNSSGNGLIGKIIREGSAERKKIFEELLNGGTYTCALDEEIVFDQLDRKKDAEWSLLLASGYLKVVSVEEREIRDRLTRFVELSITNTEVSIMFENMISDWFSSDDNSYNDFIKAMLIDDVDSMNDFMELLTMQSISFFDTGKTTSERIQPERFYHGLVLGLLVDLRDRYELRSNRESGFGRYDICLKPFDYTENPAVIIEFKVMNRRKGEQTLEDTAASALKQIEEKRYEEELLASGIPSDRIRKYGFAFEGKNVLIVKGV